MKRTILGFFVLVTVVISVFSVTSNQTPKTQKPSQEATLAGEIKTLRFGHNTPEDSALHQSALLFAEKIKNKTNGQLVIDVYPAQQLGNDHQMTEMARQGELDIVLTPTAKMSIPIPSMQYADLPFFFPSRSDVYEMLDGEPGDMLLKELRKINLFGLAFWENGFKHFTGNTPLTSPNNFAGQKIRVMKSRIIMEQFESFGAEPIAIDFHSTRQALADKVVDGQENPLVAIYSMGFHEVQSDLVLSEHAYLGYVLSISQKTMESLPFKHQELLIQTAKEVTPLERLATQEKEKQLVDKIKKSGMNVHQLTAHDKAEFSKRTKHIASRFEDVIGAAIISKTEELLFKKYGPAPEQDDHFVIGINADLKGHAGLAIKRGVKLALKEINEKGGILGKPVYLMALDHKATPSTGVNNMKYFIQRPDVIAVVGGKHSAVIAEELNTVNTARIPYLIPWAASHELTKTGQENSSIFRISANDQLASQFIAKHSLRQSNKLAILVENTIWGRGNLQNMKPFLKSKGITPSYEATFNLGKTSYSSQIDEIINSGADSVILVANEHESTIIIPELFKRNKKLPITSHWGILGGSFTEDNQAILPELNLSFFQTFLFNKSNRPQALALEKSYRKEYGLTSKQIIHSQHAVAQAYDIVQLLALAAEQADSTNRDHLITSLENLSEHEGVIKRYNRPFTETQHDALKLNDFIMARFNESGQILSTH
jgi:tripartite ATP-independent transporter DctP family solute receptor